MSLDVSLGDLRFYDARTHAREATPADATSAERSHRCTPATDRCSCTRPRTLRRRSRCATPTRSRCVPSSRLIRSRLRELTRRHRARQHPDRAGRRTRSTAPTGSSTSTAASPGRDLSRSLVAAERAAAVDHADRRCSRARGEADRRGRASAGRRRAERQRVRRALAPASELGRDHAGAGCTVRRGDQPRRAHDRDRLTDRRGLVRRPRRPVTRARDRRTQHRRWPALAYSPDGRAVASTGNDNKVIIWNPRSATPGEVLTVPAGAGARRRVQPGRTDALHIVARRRCARMGPDRRAELRTALRARRELALLRPGRAARAAARALARRHDVRRPPRHLHRRTVLSPDAAPAGIVHHQTQGRHHHRARVVTHRGPSSPSPAPPASCSYGAWTARRGSRAR